LLVAGLLLTAFVGIVAASVNDSPPSRNPVWPVGAQSVRGHEPGDRFVVSEAPGAHAPVVSYSTVIWLESSLDGVRQVLARDLGAGRTVVLARSSVDDVTDLGGAAIAGSLATWLEHVPETGLSRLFWADVREPSEKHVVTETSAFVERPSIYSYNIAWHQSLGDERDTIYAYNILSRQISRLPLAGRRHGPPASSGQLVVWSDDRRGNLDIFARDLALGNELRVCIWGGDQIEPAIDGDLVVWSQFGSDGWDIFGIDLRTRRIFPVCTDSGDQRHPAVQGQLVVWEDHGRTASTIRGAWLNDDPRDRERTGESWPIAAGPGSLRRPSVSGRLVVWESDAGIEGRWIADD
jgi:beta propeller repeat protein